MTDSPAAQTLTLRTLGRFLLGKGDAIIAVASTPKTLLLAALFIVSAGLARNYDHHVLTEEWIWLWAPFAMTLFTSLWLYCYGRATRNYPKPRKLGQNFLPFLRCFALTAPLAWIYGIPIESFSASSLVATKWNVAFLVVVSIWRVFIMIRVVMVLFGLTGFPATTIILVPACLEMFFGTSYQSMNIVGVMGGVRLDPADEFLLNATNAVGMISGGLFLFLVLPSLFNLSTNPHNAPRTDTTLVWSRSAWLAPCAGILGFGLGSIPHQKELIHRKELREKFYAEFFHEYALEQISAGKSSEIEEGWQSLQDNYRTYDGVFFQDFEDYAEAIQTDKATQRLETAPKGRHP